MKKKYYSILYWSRLYVFQQLTNRTSNISTTILPHTNSTIRLPDTPPLDRTPPHTLHNRRPALLIRLRTRLTRTRLNLTTVALTRPIRLPSHRTTEVNLASRPLLNTTVITLAALHTTVTTRPPRRPSLRTHRCLPLTNNNRYNTHRHSITTV